MAISKKDSIIIRFFYDGALWAAWRAPGGVFWARMTP